MTALTMDQQAADAQPGNINKFLVIWRGQVISMLGSGLTAFALGVWIFQKTGHATPFGWLSCGSVESPSHYDSLRCGDCACDTGRFLLIDFFNA